MWTGVLPMCNLAVVEFHSLKAACRRFFPSKNENSKASTSARTSSSTKNGKWSAETALRSSQSIDPSVLILPLTISCCSFARSNPSEYTADTTSKRTADLRSPPVTVSSPANDTWPKSFATAYLKLALIRVLLTENRRSERVFAGVGFQLKRSFGLSRKSKFHFAQ